VATDPAVLLGDRQAEEAELTELGDDAGVDRLGPVPRLPVRHDLVLEEVAGGLLERPLVLVEAEINHDCGLLLIVCSEHRLPAPRRAGCPARRRDRTLVRSSAR